VTARVRRARACALLALGAGLALPASGAAQARMADVARGVHVAEHAGATLVAVTVVVPAGSADDPRDLPGTARLTAETIAQGIRWRLDPDASRLDLRVERGWTAFTLLAAPDVWARAWGVVEDALFRLPVGDAPMAAAREQLVSGFAFEEGAPVREFQREFYRTLTSAVDPWSRDPRGNPEALRRIDQLALAGFRSTHYVMSRATVAAVGPITERAGREALAPLGTTPPMTGSGFRGPAWERGARTPLAREVTNTWIGAAFPAPPDLPRTQLEFAALELEEALNPDPPDPGMFSATVRIEDTPRGPVMVAQAAVMPEVAANWERRITRAIEQLSEERDEPFFRMQRRRFRSAILMREGVPEEASLRMALDLMREGRVRPLQQEVWEIGADELADAVDALEAPRILLMGPEIPAP